MPAKSDRQRRAAGAELHRRRMGLEPMMFEDMSIEELRKMARSVSELHNKHPKAKMNTGPMDAEEMRRMMMREMGMHMMGGMEDMEE